MYKELFPCERYKMYFFNWEIGKERSLLEKLVFQTIQVDKIVIFY